MSYSSYSSIRSMASGVRHELSNVMSVLSMSCQLLEQSGGDEQIRSDLSSVEQRLSELRDRLSLLTLPDTNRFSVVHLRSVLREMSDTRTQSDDCIVRYQDDTDDERVIQGDRRALNRLLSELLKNAVEAGREEHTEVDLILHDRTHPATISVRDSGPGFDPDLVETAFDPFVAGAGNGHGLGLSIARQVSLGHGGDIWIATDPSDTVVSCSLPDYE